MNDYVTVFGEYYLRENDAVLAACRLASRNPGNNYAVRYDCVEGLYRVVLIIGTTEPTNYGPKKHGERECDARGQLTDKGMIEFMP